MNKDRLVNTFRFAVAPEALASLSMAGFSFDEKAGVMSGSEGLSFPACIQNSGQSYNDLLEGRLDMALVTSDAMREFKEATKNTPHQNRVNEFAALPGEGGKVMLASRQGAWDDIQSVIGRAVFQRINAAGTARSASTPTLEIAT